MFDDQWSLVHFSISRIITPTQLSNHNNREIKIKSLRFFFLDATPFKLDKD